MIMKRATHYVREKQLEPIRNALERHNNQTLKSNNTRRIKIDHRRGSSV